MKQQFWSRWHVRSLMLITLYLNAAGQAALACECVSVGQPSAATRLANSDAVFVGRVVELKLPGRWVELGTERPSDCGLWVRWPELEIAYCEDDYVLATLEVERSWKGPVKERVAVLTASTGSACGIHFDVGTSYLVYAKKEAGTDGLTTGTCDRTSRVADARDDIAALGVPGRDLVLERGERLRKRQ